MVFITKSAQAQLAPDEALKWFDLADRTLAVELVAAEPLVESPCAMAFDERGRLFVAENRGYPANAEPPQGSIALLEDTDGDGRMDKRTVFADGLTFPNGVLPWQDGVLVTCAPELLFLKDTDGDGRADVRRVELAGFATSGSTQLRVNAPTLGPDGWIYLAAGLAGGRITSPAHPEKPPLKMTGDLRWQPNTGEVENVDGRSQYGMSFDDLGRRFICMNRIPVQHVVLSSKVLARNPHLAFSETVQDCSERTVKTGLRGGGDGVRLFPISKNITTADSHAGSFSAACGIHIWRGGTLPEAYRGCAFTCDPTANLVHVDRLEPRGATFSAVPIFEKEQREFLASRDDWFRPVFLTSGPDGALYICDMYRKVIEHPDYLPEEVRKRTDFESGKKMGRIWRVRPRERMASAPPNIVPPRTLEVLLEVVRLGDQRPRNWLERLATVAAESAADRWMRAAVLSGISGHEREFLNALLNEPRTTVTPVDLLVELGALIAAAESAPEFAESIADVWRRVEGRGFDWALPLFAGFGRRSPAALSGASESTLGEAISRAAEVLEARQHPHRLRVLAAEFLGSTSTNLACSSLLRCVDSDSVAEVRIAAIRALSKARDLQAASELLTAARWQRFAPSERDLVLAAFSQNAERVPVLLDAIEAGTVAPGVIDSARKQLLLKSGNHAIRERVEKLFGRAIASDRQKAFEDAKSALSLRADAAHGLEIFKTHCTTCHRLDREGFTVGPDLLDMRNQPKESILFHLVVPDAEVAPAFAAYLVETKDGRTLSGILASETGTAVTLRMPGGIEETVLRSAVARLEALPNSLMPPGLEAALSPRDLADLLAFLKGESSE